MLSNDNKEFILFIDSNINKFIEDYKRNCSTYALLNKRYKFLYFIILFLVFIMVSLSILILIFDSYIMKVVFALLSIVLIVLNIIYTTHLEKIGHKLNKKRYKYI